MVVVWGCGGGYWLSCGSLCDFFGDFFFFFFGEGFVLDGRCVVFGRGLGGVAGGIC
jgi:hypothetical protein